MENIASIKVQPQIGDSPMTISAKKKWTAEDLLEFDPNVTIDLAKAYYIAGYINASDRNIFENIPAIPIPLPVLYEKASRDILITIRQNYGAIISYMHINQASIIAKLQQHICSTYSEFLTVFEPIKDALTHAERMKIYHTKHQSELKQKAKTKKSIVKKI